MILFILSAVLTCLCVTFLIRACGSVPKKQAYGLVILFPILFVVLYALLGSPDLKSSFAKYEPPSARTELRKLIHSEATLKIEALRDPNNAGRWLKLGSLQILLDKNADAIESLDKAYALMPKNTEVQMALGAALFAQGIEAAQAEDFARAKKILNRALKIAPKKAPYYQALKETLQKMP